MTCERSHRPAAYLSAEAAILAGGSSRRMGRDKAWLDLGGRPLIGRLALTLEPLFGTIRVISNRPEAFATLHLAVQPDLRPGSGPLGGIHAALATAQTDVVFVVACDFPFLTGGFIRGMAGLLGDHDAVVPYKDDCPVPVCAFYRGRCLPAIESCLDRGELKAASFLEAIHFRRVDGEDLRRLDAMGLALVNLNTPEDYERAREIVALASGSSWQ